MQTTEYRTLRKALGLSVEDVASRFEVDRRKAQRWEVHNEPPAHVQEWILDRWDKFLDIATDCIERAEALADEGNGDVLELPIYRSEERCITETGLSYSEQDALHGHILLLCDMSGLPVRFTEVN